jgi:hypothetical protein
VMRMAGRSLARDAGIGGSGGIAISPDRTLYSRFL